jgi:hypothetical protein
LGYQIRRDNIGEACGTFGGEEKYDRVLVGKRDGEKQLVRTMRREDDNIKVCLKEIRRPNWISLVQNMDIRRAVVNVVMNVGVS